MKRMSLVILVLFGVLIGCTRTQKIAGGGALAGGAVGAILGNNARSAAVGAAIGGLLGAGASELTKPQGRVRKRKR